MTKMQPGDVVQLKSGGPLMTVSSIAKGDKGQVAFCVWFDGSKKDQASFPLHSLVMGGD